MSEDYKVRYAKNIWEQFENGIRAAAYTSRLTRFLENITMQLPIELRVGSLQDVNSVISSGCDEQVLTWLRDETTYLTMLARLMNQDRKAQYENE